MKPKAITRMLLVAGMTALLLALSVAGLAVGQSISDFGLRNTYSAFRNPRCHQRDQLPPAPEAVAGDGVYGCQRLRQLRQQQPSLGGGAAVVCVPAGGIEEPTLGEIARKEGTTWVLSRNGERERSPSISTEND